MRKKSVSKSVLQVVHFGTKNAPDGQGNQQIFREAIESDRRALGRVGGEERIAGVLHRSARNVQNAARFRMAADAGFQRSGHLGNGAGNRGAEARMLRDGVRPTWVRRLHIQQ